MHDRVLLELPGVKMRLERCTGDQQPHEVTLVLPRIEIRKTTKSAAAETTEEYIYSSITVVHAPRHPQEGQRQPRQSTHPEKGQQLSRQSMHPDDGPQRSNRSMDNAVHSEAVAGTGLWRPAPERNTQQGG